MLDPSEKTLGLSGAGLQPGDLKRHLLPEPHLRAFEPPASFLLAFKDIDGLSEKANNPVQTFRFDGTQGAAFPPAFEGSRRDPEKGGHRLRGQIEPLLHFANQARRKPLLKGG